MNPRNNRFVFVAGLHRTGTSLLSRIIGSHAKVSAISNSPAPENEGCYLQGAIPHTAMHGRPGHYAVAPEEHYAENSRYNTLETRMRLLADWSPWFDDGKPWWIEKSPVNLTRMRLYQQLFPTAQFMVILRHPQIMAAALAKWVETDQQALVQYALDAYDRMIADLPYLHSVIVLRYEDLVDDPATIRRSSFAFLSLPDQVAEITVMDGNRRYSVPDAIDAEVAARMARWGYRPGGDAGHFDPICQHPLRSVRDSVAGIMQAANPELTAGTRQKEQKANIHQ